MTVEDAMREIESHGFAARLNVASDLATFLRIAGEEDAVRALLRQLDSPDEQERLFMRALELSMSSTDLRYENQWDTALAVLLWLVSLKSLDLANLMAGVVSKAPQCWWATKMSYSLLRQSPVHNEAGVRDSEQIIYQAIPLNLMGGIDSGEAMLPISYLSEVDKGELIWHFIEPRSGLVVPFATDESTPEQKKQPIYAETGADSGAT